MDITIISLEFMQIERNKTENEKSGPKRTPNNFNDMNRDPVFHDIDLLPNKAKGMYSNMWMLCGNRKVCAY
jgi:hypothetical protein